MSLVLGAALAASAVTLPVCSWDKPGEDPFRGDTVAAVDRYTDIPPATRAALKKRIAARQFDEMAAIRRDSIEGRYSYSNLREMHFGQGQLCRSVTRAKWSDDAVERGLVYCEAGHCLIVPTVCRNVSRVTRGPAAVAEAPSTAAAPAAGVAAAPAPEAELLFDPPSAGNPTPASAALSTAAAGSALPDGGALPTSFNGLRLAGPAAGPAVPMYAAWGTTFGFGAGPSHDTAPAREMTGRRSQDETPGTPDNWRAPPLFSPTTPVPEPATWPLTLGGLLSVLCVARRRHRPSDPH